LKPTNGVLILTNNQVRQLDDNDEWAMMDMDRNMEMERMVLEAFGRSDRLQRTNGVRLERHERGNFGPRSPQALEDIGNNNNDLPNCDTK